MLEETHNKRPSGSVCTTAPPDSAVSNLDSVESRVFCNVTSNPSPHREARRSMSQGAPARASTSRRVVEGSPVSNTCNNESNLASSSRDCLVSPLLTPASRANSSLTCSYRNSTTDPTRSRTGTR